MLTSPPTPPPRPPRLLQGVVVPRRGLEVVRFRFKRRTLTDFGWDLVREESRPAAEWNTASADRRGLRAAVVCSWTGVFC